MRVLNRDEIQSIRPTFSVIQIICAVLIVGPILLFTVLYFVREEPKFTKTVDILAILGLVFGVSAVVASFVVPVLLLKDQQKVELTNAPPVIQTNTFIRYAMLEGAITTQILFWFVTGCVYLLALTGFILALKLAFFPTSNRIIAKVERMID